MAYNYDALYAENRHALGAPTQAIVDYFADLTPPLRVLDVGCGQGRDALFIARAGHDVVAVDLSPAGIADLTRDALAEDLPIVGIAADILAYTPDGLFDVILIDRTLHMLEGPDQATVLRRLLEHAGPDAHLLIADEASNMPAFREILTASPRTWKTTKDGKGYLFAHAMSQSG